MKKVLIIIFLTFNFSSFSQVGIQTSFEYAWFSNGGQSSFHGSDLYHPYIGINFKNKISQDFLIIPNLSYAPGFRGTLTQISNNINLGFDLNYFPGFTYSDEESHIGIYIYINPSLSYISNKGRQVDKNFQLKIKFGFGYDTGKTQYAIFYGKDLGEYYNILTLEEIGIKIAFYINQ